MRIGLTMIVKDEAHVLPRCLSAVRPLVHAWSIVDTGSTDATRAVAEQELRDLPGSVVERPWRGMTDSRNEALEIARSLDVDYLLALDADDTISVDSELDYHPGDGLAGYHLEFRMGDTSWWRIALVRRDVPWSYRGDAHETLQCPAVPSTDIGRMSGLHVAVGTDGARRKNEGASKYNRIAKQLEEALERNPLSARNVFYLAQSYRDAGRPLDALRTYRRRVSMGGWDEERWYAQLQVGCLELLTKVPYPVAEQSLLTAFSMRPTRAEPLMVLAEHARHLGDFGRAWLYSTAALQVPYPHEDSLFVSRRSHTWGPLDEAAFAAFKLGQLDRAAEMNERLLETDLPPRLRARIEANLAWCREAKLPPGCMRLLLCGPATYGERVTVVLPTRHAEPHLLRRAAESVLRQTYDNLLLVVVADGVRIPHDTLAHLKDDPRLVVVHLPQHRGQFFAIEVVRRATQDRLFAIQDDDDFSDADRLAHHVGMMVETQCDVVFGPIRTIDPDSSTERIDPCNPDGLRSGSFTHLGSHVGLFKREALERVGGYYAGFELGYDTMVGLMVGRLGSASFSGKPVYNRMVRTGSMTNKPATGFVSDDRQRAIVEMSKIWHAAVSSDAPVDVLRAELAARTPDDVLEDLEGHAERAACLLPPAVLPVQIHSVHEAIVPSIEEAMEVIRRHQDFCSSVSSPAMCMSVESLSLVGALMKLSSLRVVYDVGAGFSTLALRALANHWRLAVHVATFDTDVQWLEKVRAVVESTENTAAGSFHDWSRQLEVGPPDLVVFDLGNLAMRAQELPKIYDRLRPGGWLFLNDAHSERFWPHAAAFLRSQKTERFEVRQLTLDRFGRFGHLVRKPLPGA